MLVHNVPWQVTLLALIKATFAFSALIAVALLSGYYDVWVPLTVICLIVGLSILMLVIPAMLNLSRSYFVGIWTLVLVYILSTILAFAFHYQSSGLVGPSGQVVPDLLDAVYFSTTTFTTLGYGDFRPTPDTRLVTSFEALMGMVTIALTIAMLWLWCEENLLPKNMAFFDGNRRYIKGWETSRVRVRTIFGNERKLRNWVPFSPKGEGLRYDAEREEWVTMSDEELKEYEDEWPG